jgi:3-hydroxybutyrate dehydrogenase
LLKGKCALLTGSVSGIGFAIAKKLAAGGCDIVLHGLEGAAVAAERQAELERDYGVRTSYSDADLRQPERIRDMMRNATDKFGSVDIVINNAVVRHFEAIETFPEEKWNDALAVNLSSTFYTTKHALPGMRKKGYGRIVNIASTAALRAMPYRIDYATTKHALIGMTKVIALETINSGITCNALCPHSVLTPSSNARIEQLMARESLPRDKAVKQFLSNRQPAGRFVDPDKIGGTVVFLCGEDAADISGVALPIDIAWMAGFSQD